MISKCKCQSCGGEIEFEAAEFELSSETSHRKLGQTIDCPHCGKPTQIYMNKAEFIAPKKEKQNHWLFVVIGFSIVGLGILFGWLLSRSDEAALIFGNGIAAVLGCIGVVFGFILTVYWTLFPLLMTSKLNGIRDVLEKIEQNTRNRK